VASRARETIASRTAGAAASASTVVPDAGLSIVSAWSDRESMPRNDVGLILEPERAVLLEDLAGRVQIASVRHRGAQSLVFDLGDVDGRIPRGEQRGGPDRRADFHRQGVHVVAEIGASVGIGVEV